MSVMIQTSTIDATGIHYREMNERVRAAVTDGARKIVLDNVTGQRYIGTNLHDAADPEELAGVEIEINGVPGNDLGMFLNGPTITVHGNVMDGTGNTMNRGRIVAHGRAGDITGFSARGGEIFVRDNAGYRVGIHMKEYKQTRPVLTIGGTAQDFLGEYLAGGIIIVMGLTLAPGERYFGSHIGTGMHGGVIYIRSPFADHQLGEGVGETDITQDDSDLLLRYIVEYGRLFDADVSTVSPSDFTKLVPLSTRPFKGLYAY
jgi:glutamate synthase domain-containing protein 3